MSVVLEQISAEVAIYNDNFLLPSYFWMSLACLKIVKFLIFS